ncbi:MAG TPA: hypothetical protein VMG38_23810 [Trebonia sp.]|nr:hypothetical protein [Trebonia sp.]
MTARTLARIIGTAALAIPAASALASSGMVTSPGTASSPAPATSAPGGDPASTAAAGSSATLTAVMVPFPNSVFSTLFQYGPFGDPNSSGFPQPPAQLPSWFPAAPGTSLGSPLTIFDRNLSITYDGNSVSTTDLAQGGATTQVLGTIFLSPSHCIPGSDGSCLQLQPGTYQAGGTKFVYDPSLFNPVLASGDDTDPPADTVPSTPAPPATPDAGQPTVQVNAAPTDLGAPPAADPPPDMVAYTPVDGFPTGA